jgi:aspartyl-tRNA(Asn)/glutamyl-tRNA(Gln) amidotransferase subunit C
MKLKREEVLHIAALAKVGVTEADVEKFQEQLSNIMENFEVLKQIDTSEVPPTAQSFAMQNVILNDDIKPSLSQEAVLANAPQREGDYFKVKVVLED